jgi:hypothetical protein
VSDECATCSPASDSCPDQPPATPIGYRCRRANRCADGESLRCPDCNTRWARAGAEISSYDGLCEQCTTDLGVAVRGLGLDYAELHLALGRTGRSPSDWGGERVRGSAEPPIPIAAQLEALQRDIVEHATRWAQIVADNHHQAVDRFDDGRPTVRLGHAVRLLSHPTALATLLSLDAQDVMLWRYDDTTVDTLDGLQGALTILRLHEQVRAACGRAELVHHLPTPCPSCGVRALVRDNGDDKVHCAACRDEWNEDGYQWFTRVATYAYAA